MRHDEISEVLDLARRNIRAGHEPLSLDCRVSRALVDACELLELAWGLIANASEGNWSRESEEWQAVAHRWGVEAGFRAENETGPPNDPRAWNAQEVLFAFMGWLTSQPRSLVFGAAHEVPPAIDVIQEFCARYGLRTPPREGWANALSRRRVEAPLLSPSA